MMKRRREEYVKQENTIDLVQQLAQLRDEFRQELKRAKCIRDCDETGSWAMESLMTVWNDIVRSLPQDFQSLFMTGRQKWRSCPSGHFKFASNANVLTHLLKPKGMIGAESAGTAVLGILEPATEHKQELSSPSTSASDFETDEEWPDIFETLKCRSPGCKKVLGTSEFLVSQLPKILVVEEQEISSADSKKAPYHFPPTIVLFKQQRATAIRYKLMGRVLLRGGHFAARVSMANDVWVYDGMQDGAQKSKGVKSTRIEEMSSVKQGYTSSAWYTLVAADEAAALFHAQVEKYVSNFNIPLAWKSEAHTWKHEQEPEEAPRSVPGSKAFVIDQALPRTRGSRKPLVKQPA